MKISYLGPVSTTTLKQGHSIRLTPETEAEGVYINQFAALLKQNNINVSSAYSGDVNHPALEICVSSALPNL